MCASSLLDSFAGQIVTLPVSEDSIRSRRRRTRTRGPRGTRDQTRSQRAPRPAEPRRDRALGDVEGARDLMAGEAAEDLEQERLPVRNRQLLDELEAWKHDEGKVEAA